MALAAIMDKTVEKLFTDSDAARERVVFLLDNITFPVSTIKWGSGMNNTVCVKS